MVHLPSPVRPIRAQQQYKLPKVHKARFSLFLDSSQAIYFCSNQLVYACIVEMHAAHTPDELALANHQLREGSGGSSSGSGDYAVGRWLSQSGREEGVVVYAVRSSIM